jgi:hypothetical protein
MSQHRMKVAWQFGEELPAFSSLSEAEKILIQLKDSTLEAFLAEEGLSLDLDYSPESLKPIEKWYFEAGCPKVGGGNYSVSHAIGFYFGEVLCRSAGFSWIVEEFAFIKGRFEVGVNRRLVTIMLTKGKTPRVEGNKRLQSLWREYEKYAL